MDQQLQGAKGAPLRVVGSPGFLRPTDSRCRRTFSLLLLSPHDVPPRESPLPSVGLPLGRPPQDDRHRVVAVLMMRTLDNGCGNEGDVGLRAGCPPGRQRQKAAEEPLIPPGGDRTALADAPPTLRRRSQELARSFIGRPFDAPARFVPPRRRRMARRRAPGPVRHGAAPRRPSTGNAAARESLRPRTRVALRNRFRSKDPS
jgi:hypothetical protein